MLKVLFSYMIYIASLLHAKPLTNYPSVTTSPIATQPRCEYEGKFYSPGQKFNEGTDEEGRCYGLYCTNDGNVIPWENSNCATTIPTQPTDTQESPTPQKITFKRTTPLSPAITIPATTKRMHPTTRKINQRTTTPKTTTPPTSEPPSCEYEGKLYSPGDTFNEGTDGEGWCYGLYCSHDGIVVPWDDFNCGTTSSAPKLVTYPPTTIPRETIPYATSQKNIASPQTTNLKSSTTVTTPPATLKTVTEEIKTLRKKSPGSSTSEATTPPATTMPPHTTIPLGLGCEYEGKFYSPGESFNEDTDEKGGCYGLYCSHDGVVIPWDDFNCSIKTTATPTATPSSSQPRHTTMKSSTAEKTTSLQTTTPKATTKKTTDLFLTTLPRRPGCEYDGKFYSPGEDISKGSDGRNWCYGLYCTYNGDVVAWDDWNCGSTTTDPPTTAPPAPTTTPPSPTTPPEPTTNSPTTIPTTPITALPTTPPPTLIGCMHEGKFYPPGEISRGSDGKNWCYGYICDSSGQVLAWDNWNCGSTTTEPPTTIPSTPTTTPPSPTTTPEPPTTTPSPPMSIPRTATPSTILGTMRQKTKPTKTQATVQQISTSGKTSAHSTPQPVVRCFFEGKYYENGEIFSRVYHGWNWCSGWLCNEGRIDEWRDFNCVNPTTLSKGTDKSNQCLYNGEYYNDGEIIQPDEGSGNCNSFYCKGGVVVRYNGEECGSGIISSPRAAKPSTIKTHPPTRRMYPSTTVTHLPTRKSSPSAKETNPRSTIAYLSTMKLSPVRKETNQGTTGIPKSTILGPTKANTLPKPALCFHEGKYYEEGDIISRDFDGENWCSGWYCKDGRVIPVDCGDFKGTISKEDTLSPTPQTVVSPITLGPERSLCFHEGRYYEDGDLASNDFDSDNWCSSLLCQGGKMVPWNICGSEETKPKTLSSPQVTQIPDTTQVFEKTSKIPKSTIGTLFTKLISPKVTTKISGITNPDTSKMPPYTAKAVSDTSTRSPDITTRPTDTTTGILITSKSATVASTRSPDTTTRPPKTTPTTTAQTTKPEKQRCYYKEALYPPGEVTRGFLKDGRCFGVICDISGQIIQWVSDTCETTERPTAQITKTLPGCVYNDKYYPPGRISRISDGTNWCMDVICTEQGKIASLNNWDCDQATTKASTTTSTSRPNEVTCLYNGYKYLPGIIKEGVYKNGWCFKIVCQDNGELYLWGDWNCKLKPPTTTPTATSTTPSTMAPSTASPCFYNGETFPVGEITRGENDYGWCYGLTCREDGQVVLWGRMNCAKH